MLTEKYYVVFFLCMIDRFADIYYLVAKLWEN